MTTGLLEEQWMAQTSWFIQYFVSTGCHTQLLQGKMGPMILYKKYTCK